MAERDDATGLRASATKDFHHPFKPYDVQTQLMVSLYQCIEEGKVGIFESPTGEGKSLSLICGSITWLRDHKRKAFEEDLEVETEDKDEPDWMLEHAKNERRQKALRSQADLETRLEKIRERERRLKAKYENGEPQRKRVKRSKDPEGSGVGDEDRFILDDYESDDDASKIKKRQKTDDSGLSAETRALMKRLGLTVGDNSRKEDDVEVVDELKIFYCSRTHSQLSQFASELRRVKVPPAITEEEIESQGSLEEAIKHLTLGSRKNLCINPGVQKLGNATAINERCLELQQPETSNNHKCAYLPTKETEAVVNDFRDHAIATIQDIEEIASLGKRMEICPYYASRPAVKPSEVVTLPYPLLLQKSAREALDISLKDHVVVIDEAHNLIDAITGIYSSSVTLGQLKRSRAQLGVYLQKFRNRLKGKNRVYVTQAVRLLDSLTAFLESRAATLVQGAEDIVKIGDLMNGKGVDQINLFKLTKYLQESKLARKVDGYVVFAQEQQQQQSSNQRNERGTDVSKLNRGTMPVLTHVQGFLVALMNPSSEGRFFVLKDEETGDLTLKYMLLDPTYHFKEIVEEARAVILAGGTMSPMSDYTRYLFSYLPPSQIVALSCGHVVPPSSLMASPIITGSTGAEFDFTFEKRNSDNTINNLGQTLADFISKIPDGVVVFFPSYTYLDKCISAWKRQFSGSTKSLWATLSDIKPIFLEAKSAHNKPDTSKGADLTASRSAPDALHASAENTLSAYAATIAAPSRPGRGALLLAVIGGTLSEGINFSDSLGRGVIVVGLPFPNPRSAEWKAKMEYVKQRAMTTAATADTAVGDAAAREFYENACMRAVNQCLGRAIRHRGDYAAILLLDRRYAAERIRQKLPGWIKSSLRSPAGVQEGKRGLQSFFQAKAR
ncbi:helicase C-terminal domain-containing protein [Lineolata rhizophorae]|uniref:ATP-dependent DNA helicase CHL1 n=1 Tax=Lineolata rhizophorae TaxID=578093 RepID=A0A6A6P1N6_9PEZI|nr:helicase C-terminal domain-containing protein [Lineolata rhizophorae]